MGMPPPWESIDQSWFSARWPMGAEKYELIDGVIIWYGDFEEVDREAAERAFPGRIAVLVDGGLELRPGRAPSLSKAQSTDGSL